MKVWFFTLSAEALGAEFEALEMLVNPNGEGLLSNLSTFLLLA